MSNSALATRNCVVRAPQALGALQRQLASAGLTPSSVPAACPASGLAQLERLAANALTGPGEQTRLPVLRMLEEFFTPTRLACWTVVVSRAVDAALACLEAATSPDLVADFTDRLHAEVMPRLLGLAPAMGGDCLAAMKALRRLGEPALPLATRQQLDAAVQTLIAATAPSGERDADAPESLLHYLQRHRGQLPAELDTRYLLVGLLAGSITASSTLACTLHRLLSGPREHWAAAASTGAAAPVDEELSALLSAQAIPALARRFPDLQLHKEGCRFDSSPRLPVPQSLPCDLGGGSRQVSSRMCDIREMSTARALVNDNRNFSPPRMEEHLSALARGSARDLSTAIVVARNAMFFMDGERHLDLRRAVADRLGGNRLGAWEPVIDDAIARALDELATQKTPDLAQGFAERLRADVVSRILGVVPRDRARFEELAPGLQGVLAPWLSLRELERVQGVFREALEAMLATPAEDPPGLLQALLAKPPANFSADDLKAAILVLYGATFTLSHTLANILLAILSRPADERIGADTPAWIDAHLEELIVQGTAPKYIYRMARQPLNIGGLPMQPGDTARLPLLAINRGRAAGHLSFGHGLHRCIGAALSRLLIRRAVPALFSRYPSIALVPQGQQYHPMSQTVALRTLPCHLGPPKETPP